MYAIRSYYEHLMSLLKGQPWLLPKEEEIRDVAAVFEGSAYDNLDLKSEDLAKADRNNFV